jgi:hypothetical protein
LNGGRKPSLERTAPVLERFSLASSQTLIPNKKEITMTKMNQTFLCKNLSVFAIALAALLTLLPVTATGQITTNTGTLGNGTNVTNSAYREWITVYFYVKNYDFSGEILKETRWYDGASIGVSQPLEKEGMLSIGLNIDLATILDRIQPRANDTIKGKITSVEDVTLTNVRGATIGNAYIAGIGTVGGKMVAGSNGIATLNNLGVIDNAFVESYGYVNNSGDAIIEKALVYDGGELINSGEAIITDVIVLGGLLQNNGGNKLGYTTPTIEILAFQGGKVENRGEAHIEIALLNSGIVNNFDSATIGTAFFNGGIVINFDSATIGTAFVTDGTVYYGTIHGGDGVSGGDGGLP